MPAAASEWIHDAHLGAAQRRIRRLFLVLEDVALYTAGYAGTALLAQSWARISELLHADGSAATGAVRIALDRVTEHDVGSSDWWVAIRQAAHSSDEHYLRLRSGDS